MYIQVLQSNETKEENNTESGIPKGKTYVVYFIIW